MKAIQSRDSNAHTELIQMFLQNQKMFKPVMRHFFTEMRNDPVGWYAMRLKYARSVAVGSMVGHLVGLGDRHCSNIMINVKTGEILHIDLGIAFDQVRFLQPRAIGVADRVRHFPGRGSQYPRACALPSDSRYDRWTWFLWGGGCVQTLLRADVEVAARKGGSHTCGFGSLQA